MVKEKTKILIVGGSTGAAAFIRLLNSCPAVDIVGVVDPDDKAEGIRIARELNIPTGSRADDFFKKGKIDDVIDFTDKKELKNHLAKLEYTGLINKESAQFVFELMQRCMMVQEELNKAKEDLEIQAWGLKKTNEGIKLLYKELEEKNKRLEELDKLKSNFISAVSHELRTPLSVTKEGISLVMDQIPGSINEKQHKVLDTARNNIDRLARMINNLLDISKIEAGKIKVKKEIVDIVGLVKQVSSFFEPKVRNKGLNLRSYIKDERIELFIDADKIVQVFTNLIGNALKFTDNGTIDIHVEDRGNDVLCAVSDTGRGIAKEDLPKMFSKFEQFGRTEGGGEKGTGLGLAITKEIVELHRGSISVESEPGKGSRFTFNLPKYSTDEVFKEYVALTMQDAQEVNKKVAVIIVKIMDKSLNSRDALKDIADRLKEVINVSLRRTGDRVVGGGDEILVSVISGSKEDSGGIGRRLKDQLDEYLTKNNLSDKIRLHFGGAVYPDDAKSPEELINKAKR
ncbi:MAG: hypothetical protein JW800_08050 [Candidatus Omnitrophica bacterium]|nr:hypothetical protein [Candidatus Omnitrophota bacterium]